MGYLYISLTILFTVYGQLILKWRVIKIGALPSTLKGLIPFFINFFSDPFILSGLVSAFVASLCWMAAMTKFQISYAYPFMSLSFVLVTALSVYFFGETFTLGKAVGLSLIMLGIFLTYKLN